VSWLLGDTPNRVLKLGMDVATLRHQVIANNIANVDTPYFLASDVSFEAQLRAALAGEGAGGADLSEANPVVYRLPSTRFRIDGNTVDIDWETVKLSQNTARYNAEAAVLRRRLAMWRRVVGE